MKLYHGTSSKYLKAILRKGIKPRGEPKQGNWKHSVTSNPKAVYLTQGYAIYLAQNAIQNQKRHDLVLIEVDTDKLNSCMFAPDEDYLEQATRGEEVFPDAGKDMLERTLWFRERAWSWFHNAWHGSVEDMGTCSYYDSIPVSAITRVAQFPYDHPLRWMSDPSVSIINHRIMGVYYRNLTKRVFGDSDWEDDPLQMSERILSISRDGVVVRTMI
jgi:hypothetical protein